MIAFGTKAETLSRISNKIKSALVLPQFMFTVDMFEKSGDEVWNGIINKGWEDKLLIIRSSAKGEDSINDSMAGKYTSVLNIKGKQKFIDGVNNVISSYDVNNCEDQILVQPMLTDVFMSGVVFTIDPNTGGNYYVVNYDDCTGSTSSVTSGCGLELKTYYLFKNRECTNEILKPVIKMAKDLEALFNYNNIDIEFAITTSKEIYILQVRPLIIKSSIIDIDKQKYILESIEKKVLSANEKKPYLYGEKTIFGVMPDWNPAEIIGLRPRPLATSLYKDLITDGTWAYQRDNYGYKNLRSFPLMMDFNGLPYIDVRVSFNSFLPKELNDNLSEKLINFYLNKLEETPDNHDKIEFEIVFSCYSFNLDDRICILDKNGFTEEEQLQIKNSLLKLTNNIINIKNGLWILDTKKISILEGRRKLILESNMDDVSKIYWLLEDCIRYGTLPFAGLARTGFIAIQILKSLVKINILSTQEYENYLAGLNTISSTMVKDKNQLSKDDFIEKYGHLRPGTYDITSMRYDATPELYFSSYTDEAESNKKDKENKFKLSLEQYSEIQNQMNKHGILGDVLSLFEFIKSAIEGREYSKFIFTKSLSDAIEIFAGIGSKYGFSREDMSFANISIIKQLYSSTDDIKKTIETSIKEGKEKYNEATKLVLPSLIFNANEIKEFHMIDTTPNFITMKVAMGEICKENWENEDLVNKILILPAADPGFDWIFSRGIKGFITAYGGVNSHMAIRASELSIPAVIGVGEKLYNSLSKANTIKIDCESCKIDIIK